MTRRNKKNGAKGSPSNPASLTRSAGFAKGSGGASRGRSGQQVAVAYGQQVRNMGPRFVANGRSLTVCHREYVTRVLGHVNYSVSDPLSLNPARYQPFPWLSDIARKFESYMFRSLRFIYVPSCPSSSKGSVSMVIDYDAADPAPTGVQEMLQYQGAVRGPCWQELILSADTEYLQLGGPRRFTRHANVPVGKDIKTYDAGTAFLAVDGFVGDDQVYGDLFVEYAVELFVPQPASDFELEESAVVNCNAASVNKAEPFGALGASVVNGLLELAPMLDKIYFKQPGEYKLDYSLTGTGLNSTAPDFSGSTATVKGYGPLAAGDGLASRGTVAAIVKNVNDFVSLKFPTVTTVSSTNTRISPFAYDIY